MTQKPESRFRGSNSPASPNKPAELQPSKFWPRQRNCSRNFLWLPPAWDLSGERSLKSKINTQIISVTPGSKNRRER